MIRLDMLHPAARITLTVFLGGSMLALMFALVGCGEADQVRKYQVDKPEKVYEGNHVDNPTPLGPDGKPLELTDRMLTVLLRRENAAWFFKLAGPKDDVAAQEEAFRKFVASVRFEKGPSPTWQKPELWSEKRGPAPRFATLTIPPAKNSASESAKPLEVSVSELPYGGVSESEYLLSNVNRWRGQMSLGPTRPSNLAKQIESIDIGPLKGTFVSLDGVLSSDGMSRAPFAAGRMPGAGATPRDNRLPADHPPIPNRAPAPASSPLAYDTPTGWRPAAGDGISSIAMEATQGGETARVTVSALAAAAGELEPNINRWRGQVELPPVEPAEIEKSVKPFEVAGVAGQYVSLVGPSQTILGVIFVARGQAWFVKLRAPNGLAERETDRFAAFARSLRFTSTAGVSDGQ